MAKGYQSYRGRRSAGTVLLIVILVLILLGACGFIFVQRYLVYTDDGGMYLDLPFVRIDLPVPPGAEEPLEPEPEEDSGPVVNLTVEPAEPEEPPEPEPPADVYGERKVVELSALPATPGDLTAALAAAGANGFVWQVRDDTGLVHYASAQAIPDAVAKDAAAAEAVTALCMAEDVVSVARFNVLHDSYYAFANMAEAAICQKNGYVWYDRRSYFWLDPEKDQARSYVTALAVECAQLGFDELLLEELAYPTEGKLQKINYANNTLAKADALALLLMDLRSVLEPYGTRLSLLLPEKLLTAGDDADSGQNLSVLLPLVDAVYVETADPAAAEALLTAWTGDAPAPVLVPMTAEPGEGNWCTAAQ